MAQQAASLPVAKPSRKKARVSSFGLTNDLKSLQQKIKEEQANAPIVVEEAPVVYEVNPALKVDEAAFQSAKQVYIERLKEANKMNLASILQNGVAVFEHNFFTFSVENDIFRGLLERESELLPFLRKEIGMPELYMEVIVQEKEKSESDEIPYSPEGKLKAMTAKNPHFQELQKIFKTRIIY